MIYIELDGVLSIITKLSYLCHILFSNTAKFQSKNIAKPMRTVAFSCGTSVYYCLIDSNFILSI